MPYGISILLFGCFKWLYPQPDIFLDSTNYIEWALKGHSVTYRPIGYSLFLKFLEGSANNYMTIVLLQYLLFLFATYFFNSTIFRLFSFSNTIKIFTYCLTIYNPFAFFLANLIAPDSFFLSFTAIWLTSMLLMFSGRKKFYTMLGLHLLSYIVLFHLRYNAVYYPIITVLSVLIYKPTVKHFIIVGSSVLLVYLLYRDVIERNKLHTGAEIFSAFGGWILANNAIHIYNMADVEDDIFSNDEEYILHKLSAKFKDSVGFYERGKEVTDEYMWDERGPLKRYAWKKVETRAYNAYFIAWYHVAATYGSFGKTLITNYPIAFLEMFYLPNLKSYFFPKLETMERYDVYHTNLTQQVQQYTGINSPHLPADIYNLQHRLMKGVRWVYLFIDILSLAAIAMLIIRRIQKHIIPEGMKLLALFYIVVLMLSALGHPILIRYIAVLLILGNILPLAYIAWEAQRRKLKKPA